MKTLLFTIVSLAALASFVALPAVYAQTADTYNIVLTGARTTTNLDFNHERTYVIHNLPNEIIEQGNVYVFASSTTLGPSHYTITTSVQPTIGIYNVPINADGTISITFKATGWFDDPDHPSTPGMTFIFTDDASTTRGPSVSYLIVWLTDDPPPTTHGQLIAVAKQEANRIPDDCPYRNNGVNYNTYCDHLANTPSQDWDRVTAEYVERWERILVSYGVDRYLAWKAGYTITYENQSPTKAATKCLFDVEPMSYNELNTARNDYDRSRTLAEREARINGTQGYATTTAAGGTVDRDLANRQFTPVYAPALEELLIIENWYKGQGVPIGTASLQSIEPDSRECRVEAQPSTSPQSSPQSSPQQQQYGSVQSQNTPTADPALIAKVQSYADERQHGADHVEKWTRVLAAFGVVDHNDPMTAAEAKANTKKYDPNRWTPVYEQLLILEAAEAQPQQAPQQQPQQAPAVPDTQPQQPVQSQNTPTVNPALIAKVQSYADERQHGADHVEKWTRVLAAFGVVDHNDPMTAAEAKANTKKYDPNRWTPVYEQLLILEAAEAQPQQAPQQAPAVPDTQPQQPVQSQNTPTTADPALIQAVKGYLVKAYYNDDPNDPRGIEWPNHLPRWLPALAALTGDYTDYEPMTSEKAFQNAKDFDPVKWIPVAEEILRLEQAAADQ